MAMGMGYDEYWDGDNEAPAAYLERDRLLQERRNELAWLQGMYIAEAIGAAMSKKHKYPKEPYPISKKDMEKREEKEQKEADAKFFDYMMTMTEHLNQRIAKKQFEKKMAESIQSEQSKGGGSSAQSKA